MLNSEQYFGVPTSGVSRTVALSISLLSAVPLQASPPVINAAQAMRSSVVALQKDWAARLSKDPNDTTVRPVDRKADSAWRGLHIGLQSAATLENTPRGDAANTVLQRIFPDGRTFLALAFKDQWAEAERRLQLIEAEELEELIALAVGGPDHLEAVRSTHEAYGKALNITEAADPQIDIDLAEGVQALRAGIRGYLLQVVAWANQDPANTVAATNALAPVADARDEWNRRRAGGNTAPPPAVTPTTPIPVVS